MSFFCNFAAPLRQNVKNHGKMGIDKLMTDKSQLDFIIQNSMDKISYSLGLGIGQQLKNMVGSDLVMDDFVQAVRDVLDGAALKVGHREAQQILNTYFQEKQAQDGKAAREEGEKFLAENAKKEGVVSTKSGLQYKVLTEGTGKSPKATDKVRCHYEGFLLDGSVFDSSVQRGEPADFPLQGVIAGWTEGLQYMKEGGKTRFFIPYMLAYGEGGAGSSIPPYATLIFDVELIKVL